MVELKLFGACAECQVGATYEAFEDVRSVGIDETEGRFADVVIERCRSCGAHWVRYYVEYEAFSRSGRWARGWIEPEHAQTIPAEDVTQYLASLESFAYGGSYWGHAGAIGKGNLVWSP